MIGPVFALEWLQAGRRRRAHVLRWTLGAVLVVELALTYSDYSLHATAPGSLADFAAGFLRLVLLQQYLFVAVVTPGLVAGTITDEKTRGTLESLLTSQIDAPAIIVGKLLARLADVIVLTLVALPMVAFAGSFAGVGAAFVFGQAAVTIMTAFGLSSVSVLASVWTRHTRNAVLMVYLLVGAAVTLYVGGWWPLPAWTTWFDPLYALRPAYDGGSSSEFFRRLGQAGIGWGTLALVCIGLASWRLRPAYVKQLSVRRRWYSIAHWLPRPAPSWNPLAWKESYAGRRIPLWLGLTIVAALTAASMLHGLSKPSSAAANLTPPAEVILNRAWFAIGFLSLLVAVHASGAITTERERQTWDGLMGSPMNFRDILIGKVRGIVSSAWPYALTFGLTSAAIACLVTRSSTAVIPALGASLAVAALIAVYSPGSGSMVMAILAALWSFAAGPTVFAVVTVSLAVAWLVMNFVASVGVWSSVRCTSSWRSLMLTSLLAIGGGTVLICASTPVACVTSLVGAILVGLLEQLMGLLSDQPLFDRLQDDMMLALLPIFIAAGIALVFWFVARSLVVAAEVYLARTERIPTGRVRQTIEEHDRRERAKAQALPST